MRAQKRATIATTSARAAHTAEDVVQTIILRWNALQLLKQDIK